MTEINQVAVKTNKRWWRSKTLRLNAFAAVLGGIELNAHLIQPYIAGNVYAYGFFGVVVINYFLRFLTNQGIGK